MSQHRDTSDPRSAPGPRVGDTVVAQDGVLGHVDRVVRTERRDAAYLVVASRRLVRRRYPVIPSAFVARIDPARRCVYVRGRRTRLERLSETLPLVV
jgi:hypothetical protein